MIYMTNNLSYSSIQRYGYIYKYPNKQKPEHFGCHYSYYLKYICNITQTDVDSKYGQFGTVIHNILCDFYPTAILGCIPNYPSPRDYFNDVLKNLLNKHWDFTLSDTMFKDALNILSSFAENEAKRYENFRNGTIAQFNPLHRELSIPEPFNIRIDKVLPDHTLMDYKTTKHPPEPPKSLQDTPIEYILQAGIYAISYQHHFKIWPPKMVYYFLRTSKPMVVPITQEVIDITSKISNEVIENINMKKFDKNPDNCQYCDMRHICGLETIQII